MSRRSRLLYLTLAGAAVFMIVATGATLRWRKAEPAYKPGEDREGITAELVRSLPPDYPRVHFTDVTSQSGIEFQHFSGKRSSQLPEDMGSGAAWGDFDNDGWVDLVVSNEVGPLALDDTARRQSPARARLYRNDRGQFTDVTDRSGIDFRGWGMGVAWGDYDNDGHIDLVLTAYGRNVLYHDNGDGTFSDRSLVSRVGVPEGFWTGASWGDYDRDGLLDLYVTGYVKYSPVDNNASPAAKYDVENPASINPSSFAPERNLLFHNNGNGVFSEVAAHAGVADTTGRGLSAAWADFDGDGWIDLYVANDQSDNAFFRNLGNGTFRNISHSARVADYRSAMGIAVGDWDNDGALDLYLTHWLAQENALYTNQLNASKGRSTNSVAKLTFRDDADRVGLGQSTLDFVGWATSFTDYDNDGKVDLFVVNGSTLQDRSDPTRLIPMRDQLFWNRGNRKGFFDVSPAAGATFGKEFVGRGAAFADFDNDGDDDVFVVNHGGPGILLRNDGGNRNHWLQVLVRGSKTNRQGMGALVRVVVGDTVQTRQIGAQSSYLSQNSLIETFGLGGATRVDTLEVRWPGGARDVRTGVAADSRVEIIESASTVSERDRVQKFWALYREASSLRVARQTQRASDVYARALELDPRHEDVLYYYGGMRLELGDFSGAAKAWRTLASVNPAGARAHSALGALYACLDGGAPFQLDSAERHLQRAHEINKEETGPLVRLGEVALMRSDLAAAKRQFDAVLVTHASNVPARFYSGYVAWKRGDSLSARNELVRAIAALTIAPPVAAAPSEGDTKRGLEALTASTKRCAQLSELTARLRGASTRDMIGIYRELDRALVR